GGDLFNAMIAGMGFDLEHRLAAGKAPGGTNLKQLLLQLMHALDTAATQKGIPVVSPQLSTLKDATAQALTAVLEQSLARLLPEGGAGPVTATAVSTLSNDLLARLQQPLSALWTTIERLLADAQKLSGGGRSAGNSAQQVSRPDQVESFIRDALSKLESTLRQLTEALLRTARPLLPAFVSPIVSTGGPISGLPADTLLAALNLFFEKGLHALFGRTAEQENALVRGVETLLRESLRSGLPHQSSVAKGTGGAGGESAPQMPAGKTEGDGTFFDRPALRQNLEMLIQRLESQQLLARQTPTAAGEQQILALPVKIGDEWTEMHVRFIRQRSRKGGDRGHFRVYLNVAPALLGAIEARLDYQKNRSISVAIEFESAATHAWFCAKQNDLREALSALGVPSPRIELFRPRALPAGEDTGVTPLMDGATIDLKA
ncbi:MAG: hypothetical protein JW699_01630, partial [Chitinispirillaceae bacterium]|nr:hypothetical protein [Chitinispirillaceae bacterium]